VEIFRKKREGCSPLLPGRKRKGIVFKRARERRKRPRKESKKKKRRSAEIAKTPPYLVKKKQCWVRTAQRMEKNAEKKKRS